MASEHYKKPDESISVKLYSQDCLEHSKWRIPHELNQQLQNAMMQDIDKLDLKILRQLVIDAALYRLKTCFSYLKCREGSFKSFTNLLLKNVNQQLFIFLCAILHLPNK